MRRDVKWIVIGVTIVTIVWKVIAYLPSKISISKGEQVCKKIKGKVVGLTMYNGGEEDLVFHKGEKMLTCHVTKYNTIFLIDEDGEYLCGEDLSGEGMECYDLKMKMLVTTWSGE